MYEITSDPERLSWQKRYSGAAHCTYQSSTPGDNGRREPQHEERTTPQVPLQLQVIAVKAFVVVSCIGHVLTVCGIVVPPSLLLWLPHYCNDVTTSYGVLVTRTIHVMTTCRHCVD
jgi:hypothetical protein